MPSDITKSYVATAATQSGPLFINSAPGVAVAVPGSNGAVAEAAMAPWDIEDDEEEEKQID